MNDPKRLLYFTHSLVGGGAERQLLFLLNNHSDYFKVGVCYDNNEGYRQIPAHVKAIHIPRKRKTDLRLARISRAVREWQPDLVISWLPYTVTISLLPTKLVSNAKFATVWQGSDKVDSWRRCHQLVSHLAADAVAANVVADDLNFPYQQIFKKKKGQFIPNGFDLERIRTAIPLSLVDLGLDNNKPTVVFVGRLIPLKNVDTIIKAIYHLKTMNQDIQLIICGDGVLRAELETLAVTLNVSEHILFTGFRQDIYSIVAASDIIVMASFTEGLPNALFEGMAAGAAAVVSDIPVHRRWIQHEIHGLHFDPHNAHDLAVQIKRFVNDNQLRETCQQNGKNVAFSLSIERLTQSFEAWYQTLLTP